MSTEVYLMGNTPISFTIDTNILIPLLMEQHRFLMKYLGTLFPMPLDPFTVERILDVACGPAGWVLDVAHAHRDIEVVGLDRSAEMIEYARTLTGCQNLDNALFTIDDMLYMSAIDDNMFQYVHARFVADAVPALPVLLKELARVCAPGGTLLWIEGDLPVTNSIAFQQWQQLTPLAVTLLGQTNGVTARMDTLLQDAGYVNVHKKVYRIDFSARTSAHIDMYHVTDVLSRSLHPLHMLTTTKSPEEVEHARQKMLLAMLLDDFCASMSITMVWGQKPA